MASSPERERVKANAEHLRNSRLVCVRDYEVEALARLDKNARDYYRSGADGEQTLKRNNTDFQRFRLN